MKLTDQENPGIASERIILRKLNETDVHEIMHLFDSPLDETKARQLIHASHTAWQEGREYIFGVIAKEDMKLKGLIEFYEENGGLCMTGYRTMPSQRGRGYAKEALRTLVRELLKEDADAVYAAVSRDNESSVKVLLACGFEKMEEKDGKMLFVLGKNAA